ncbi:MAG: hypothetical protein ABIQ34_12860 [Tepidiformaceae bacterium]
MDRIAQRVFEMLAEVRPGTIVAVWQDGAVSAHRSLGFRFRTLPDGSREEPLTSFVKGVDGRSVASIGEQLRLAVEVVAPE